MLPIDSEFGVLYYSYGLVLIGLLLGLFISKHKKPYFIDLGLYCSYTGYMAYLFLDEENFKHGGALVVLFFGAAFLIGHILIFIGFRFFRNAHK